MKRRLVDIGTGRPVALERGLDLGANLRPESVNKRLASGGRVRDWFSLVRNEATGTAEIMIYDEIGYWGTTAKDFVQQLGRLDAETISLRINSPGGEVYDGVAIYNALVEHDARVEVSIDGLAASVASVIAMAGDEIVIAKTAELMIHDAWGFTIGNAAEHEKATESLHRISDNIAGVYADRAGGEQADWRVLMQAETWYGGEAAVAAGLADRVKGRTDQGAQDKASSIYNQTGRRSGAPDQQEPFTLDVAGLASVLKGTL